jgi:hypothetical protein
MVGKVEANGITWMNIHSLGETAGEQFNPLLELAERDFLAGWPIDKSHSVGVAGGRHVSDSVSPEHESVDVCVWNECVFPWCANNVLGANGDVGHRRWITMGGARETSRGKMW